MLEIKQKEIIIGYPIIIPIIIYTGNQKWKKIKKIKTKQISDYIYENDKIDLEYNLVDINKFSKQMLLEKNTMFANMMLLEKSESKEKLMQNLKAIRQCSQEKEKLEEIEGIIVNLLDNIEENTHKVGEIYEYVI